MVDVFRETFCWLPLGYVLGGAAPTGSFPCCCRLVV